MRVIVQMDDGTEQIITGDVRYERTIQADNPRSDVSIRVNYASVVVGAGTPDRIELAPCHACGAPQGPLVLG